MSIPVKHGKPSDKVFLERSGEAYPVDVNRKDEQ
jgi:hypothetical protein